MGFKTKVGFRTKNKFSLGFGLVIRLASELPLRYNEAVFGNGSETGLTLTGLAISVHGVEDAPLVGSTVSVLVRPGDTRSVIFDGLLRANEGFNFLLEGVVMTDAGLEARWAHGAGQKRRVETLEIVGAPHLTFQNPIKHHGPRNGWLYLQLDGSPTRFDIRSDDGIYVSHELAYDEVVARLATALDRDLKFRVTQRVLVPSKSALVDDQTGLEAALTSFRAAGYTACVVRSFVPGTVQAQEVDVQLMTWPIDVPADGEDSGIRYDMPMLKETKRFVALRDGTLDAAMEVIPGFMANLVGNKDAERSTKHSFARGVVKGLSDAQMAMYGSQGYGPGVALSVVAEDGNISGMTRLAIRTQGPQFSNLARIPTAHFPDADKVKFVTHAEPNPADAME